jgi:hypothetical protein
VRFENSTDGLFNPLPSNRERSVILRAVYSSSSSALLAVVAQIFAGFEELVLLMP